MSLRSDIAQGARLALWSMMRPETIRGYRESAQEGTQPPARITAHLDRRLRDVIADAACSVPWYREQWRALGILSDAERGDVPLRELPPLTRADLQSNGAQLKRIPATATSHVSRTTGGSTGEPVAFMQSRRYLEMASGRGLRSLAWGGWRIGARTAMVWGGPNELRDVGGFRDRAKALLTNRRIYDAFRTGPDVYEQWLADWRVWRPEFVLGYASALEGVALHLRTQGAHLHGVKAVFSTAEKLYPHQRSLISSAFGAPVRDQYGSREVLAVAAECTAGRLHAYLDSAYLEVEATAPGQPGRVLLTQLDNPDMPLIRYANGDLAEWASEDDVPCPCGLAYPVVRQIHGRTSDLFRFHGGRIVHGEYFTHMMYDLPGILVFQFHQNRDGDVMLYVVPSADADRDMLLATLNERLQRLPVELATPFRVDLKLVTEIPRTGQGKHRFTRSDVSE